MQHVMVDLETMGIGPMAAIVSIGAVEFDPETGKLGKEFYENVSLESSMKLGLNTDASTIEWWLQQEDAARKVLLDDPTPLPTVLNWFRGFFKPGVQVWAHGPSFDLVILASAYRAMGERAPWSFRDERDTRTTLWLANATMQTNIGTTHNALDDAKTQAISVSQAIKKLRGKK